MDDEFRNLICEAPQSTELEKMARRKGMRSLKEDGWNKVVEGKTSLSEILRVTQQ
jgi:type II secretory ATPase GspE/PulE/Tfp pilus assembly ATPase PilB-like protein